MRYRYYTCDVFTEERFGGNPLAVLPEAEGLSEAQMQQIAREFAYSETTFVRPGPGPDSWAVRIFTPSREVPFAGHPNVGTAFVLATTGAIPGDGPTWRVTFDEAAGPVPITIERGEDGRIRCELTAPQRIAVGDDVAVPLVAQATGLAPGDLRLDRHAPCVASVGLPFVIAEVADVATLGRARPSVAGGEALAETGHPPDVYVYARGGDGSAIRARMFAPLDGVPEDPATGSAGCALAGLLAHLDAAESAALQWDIVQGVEMGRPSRLAARAQKLGGEVTGVWIGGASVMVAEGFIEAG
ncbi:MAG TPA: PhzF family phenazine biosynthesis protein [Alphaproteobacteria bacterium]|nr:PhzF family phenazine biosynthesis protein [Alphaproteobacteria bacterium]